MALEPGDDNYICLLDSDSKKKARDELNEIESDRACAVQTFRKWVLDQKDWLKAPTDFEFLLRFLRVRKFSQIGARLSLENFLTSQTLVPEWFTYVDPADAKLQELLRLGFFSSPMKLDKDNRRIVIERLGQLDIAYVKKEIGTENIFKAICLFMHWLIRDENVQVNGLKVFTDWSGVTMQHATSLYTPENTKKLLNYFQNSIPVRMKGLNFYNEPPFFDAVYAIFRPLMKEKSKRRMILHGKNMTSVYEVIDKSVLPKEYLPDEYTGPNAGPMKQIVDDMVDDMLKPEFRNHIKELSDPKYGVDLSLKPKEDEPVATYRKLNID